MPPKQTNLLLLKPAFLARVRAFIAKINDYEQRHATGYTWKPIETVRTVARQQWLYAQGRTRPGKIVTWKDGVKSRSNHQDGVACDFWCFRAGQPDWNPSGLTKTEFREIAESCGLHTGAAYGDYFHVEMSD